MPHALGGPFFLPLRKSPRARHIGLAQRVCLVAQGSHRDLRRKRKTLQFERERFGVVCRFAQAAGKMGFDPWQDLILAGKKELRSKKADYL